MNLSTHSFTTTGLHICWGGCSDLQFKRKLFYWLLCFILLWTADSSLLLTSWYCNKWSTTDLPCHLRITQEMQLQSICFDFSSQKENIMNILYWCKFSVFWLFDYSASSKLIPLNVGTFFDACNTNSWKKLISVHGHVISVSFHVFHVFCVFVLLPSLLSLHTSTPHCISLVHPVLPLITLTCVSPPSPHPLISLVCT